MPSAYVRIKVRPRSRRPHCIAAMSMRTEASEAVKHRLVVILILGYLCVLSYVRCQRVVLAVDKERER